MPLPGTQYHGTGSAKGSFIQFPTGQVPVGLPGRGILRHHSFKLQSLQKNIFLTFLPIWKKLVKSIEYEHHLEENEKF